MKIISLQQVVDAKLCSGCGACAGVDPQRVRMADVIDEGFRPEAIDGDLDAVALRDLMEVCPGVELRHTFNRRDPALVRELMSGWGPVLEIWEGHAADDQIRKSGSSGGAVSALALHLLERENCGGVVHTASRSDSPWLNETVYSQTRQQLAERTGSRYAPASPADGIPLIKQSERRSVFIGKPCDVAALGKACRRDAELDGKVGLSIAVFCAGTPSTAGTLAMLRKMGIGSDHRLMGLRYRGDGWPGMATAVLSTDEGTNEERRLSYHESWGEVLSKHVQWRCRVCADHTGEFADIAVGDPWYRTPEPGEEGESLIVARTPRGRAVVAAAVAAGYLIATKRAAETLPASQPNLLRTRGAMWGRIWASRLIGMPAPRYKGLPTFRFWISELSAWQKAQSFVGTWKRLRRRERGSLGP